MHKISLEQWRMFVTVVDCGGFAQAGDALFKTQSTVSHGIKKLESALGKSLFDVIGRKAVLTPFGASVLESARLLVTHADALEHEAISHKKTFQTSLSVAIDTLYPKPKLYQALSQFSQLYPDINVQIYETVLSRCSELLEDGTVDMGIASTLPKGFMAQVANLIDMQAVVSKEHPLATKIDISFAELELHRQIVIRDGGLRKNSNSGWLGANARTTVSSLPEALEAVKQQVGFAWLPTWLIEQTKVTHKLLPLSLAQGQIRTVSLQLGLRSECKDNPQMDTLVTLLLDNNNDTTQI
ncbi:LysR family transcriptional regulator [Alteromonadaceae bacterium BrNp21-10]|nr:LysR family transcriptional regulator [Alteromonadaceae bacterium BrNp21-10]